jgi:hypothetical protein
VKSSMIREDCLRRSDVIVITTPWTEFRGIRPEQLRRGPVRPAVLDCWRILERQTFRNVADYVAFGVHEPQERGLPEPKVPAAEG